jgi:hypothetical protein
MALIAELDSVAGWSSERRTEILRQVMKLFSSDADRFSESQVAVFDDVILRLIEQLEERTLTQLSHRLSEISLAPRKTVRQLALHENALVAAPLLRKSNRLSEQDVLQIAGERGQQHLLAMAARQTINEPLSDLLAMRGDLAVQTALVQNLGARFSERGYAALGKAAEGDDDLARALAERSGVPSELRRKLQAKLVDARTRLLQTVPPAMTKKIQAAVEAPAGVPAEEAIDYKSARAKVVEFGRTGRLNDQSVNKFAVRREYVDVVAALSFLSEAPIEIIAPLMKSDQIEGLVVACKAARLNWTTTTMIIRNRPGCPPVARHALEKGKDVFETLSLSVAQRTIRIASERITTRK